MFLPVEAAIPGFFTGLFGRDAAGAESFYREIKKLLAENRERVHFGLEWEDQYILRHRELL